MADLIRDRDDTAAALAGFSTSLLSDVRAGQRVLAPEFQRFAGSGTVAGRAVTARCEEGVMQAVFAALEEARPGDFLCIQGSGNTAYLGDVLATNLVNRQLAAVLVDGFVRDRAAIASLPISIFARGVTPVNLRRQGGGDPQVQLVIAGVPINPGDWIVADEDGVIVIPPVAVDATLEADARQMRVEARVKELILDGVKVPQAVRQAMAEVD